MAPLHYRPHLLTLRLILKTVLVFSGLILLFSYLVFQARFLIQGPIIKLATEPTIRQTDRTVKLSGTVQNITHLTLNGRQIFTNENGYFDEALVLENGYTIATLAATDRYGRKTTVTQPFVYTPPTTNNESS